MTWPWVSRRAFDVLTSERDHLRSELRIAQDRLLSAWRDDKAIIPPREEPVIEEEPLPQILEECVAEWESPEAQQAERARLRVLFFEKRMSEMEILKWRENQHGN